MRQVKPEGKLAESFSFRSERYNDTESDLSSVKEDSSGNGGKPAKPTTVYSPGEARAQDLVGSSTRPANIAHVPAVHVPSNAAAKANFPILQEKAPEEKVSGCCGKCDFM